MVKSIKLHPGERVISKSQLNSFNIALKSMKKLPEDTIKYKTRDSRLMYNLSLITLIINTLVLIGILILTFQW